MRSSDEKQLLGHEAGQVTTEIDGLSDGAEARTLARLDIVSMATLVCLVVLSGCMLLAAGPVGRLQNSHKPVGTPDTVVLVGFYCVSGMPHNRDYRRYAASRRTGGGYGCLPAQLRWFGQAETARSCAPVDSAVPSCNVTTVQGESGRYADMVQTWSGSSSASCARTRQDGGRACWVAAPWPQECDLVALQREQTASTDAVIGAFSGINGTEPGSGPIQAMTGGFLSVFSTAVRKLADAAPYSAVAGDALVEVMHSTGWLEYMLKEMESSDDYGFDFELLDQHLRRGDLSTTPSRNSRSEQRL